ncbi:hypothetical protein Acr_00g0040920 [Actinidia rufa]|uniref:Uncharacterized protein n=1 Tax=Actinidia rufa TaxID=165716 RepID=A0A7J0DJ13_9ERIC|nr:hypothetical protein Acr_00g0040920 [Actinidia rufa]
MALSPLLTPPNSLKHLHTPSTKTSTLFFLVFNSNCVSESKASSSFSSFKKLRVEASLRESENKVMEDSALELVDNSQISATKVANKALELIGEKSKRGGGVMSGSDCCSIIFVAFDQNNADLALSLRQYSPLNVVVLILPVETSTLARPVLNSICIELQRRKSPSLLHSNGLAEVPALLGIPNPFFLDEVGSGCPVCLTDIGFCPPGPSIVENGRATVSHQPAAEGSDGALLSNLHANVHQFHSNRACGGHVDAYILDKTFKLPRICLMFTPWFSRRGNRETPSIRVIITCALGIPISLKRGLSMATRTNNYFLASLPGFQVVGSSELGMIVSSHSRDQAPRCEAFSPERFGDQLSTHWPTAQLLVGRGDNGVEPNSSEAPFSDKCKGKELSTSTPKRPHKRAGETSSGADSELWKPEFSACELGGQVMAIDSTRDHDTSVALTRAIILPNDVVRPLRIDLRDHEKFIGDAARSKSPKGGGHLGSHGKAFGRAKEGQEKAWDASYAAATQAQARNDAVKAALAELQDVACRESESSIGGQSRKYANQPEENEGVADPVVSPSDKAIHLTKEAREEATEEAVEGVSRDPPPEL